MRMDLIPSNLDIIIYKRIIKLLNYDWSINLTVIVHLISLDSYIAISIISPQHPQLSIPRLLNHILKIVQKKSKHCINTQSLR
jgi:hypothetical protein